MGVTDLNRAQIQALFEHQQIISQRRRTLAQVYAAGSYEQEWLTLAVAWYDVGPDHAYCRVPTWPPRAPAPPTTEGFAEINPLLVNSAAWRPSTVIKQINGFKDGTLATILDATAGEIPRVRRLADTELYECTEHNHRIVGHQLVGTESLTVFVIADQERVLRQRRPVW